jgi:predicted RNA-binding Zn-ribbon protein involved in translation (DUF1610 family)
MSDEPSAPWWDRKIHTDRVAGWTYPCPECKRPAVATGNLFHHRPPLTKWVVEYRCERCGEVFTIWAPETDDAVETIVREERHD